jgi:hypothetical protein
MCMYESMELSPFREATNCAATQEPNILRNPKIHYRAHKSLPLVSMLCCFDSCPLNPQVYKKKELRGFSPLANYADRAVAAGQRS